MKKFNSYIGALLLGGLLLGATACEMRDELKKRVPVTDTETTGAFSLSLLSNEGETRAAGTVDKYVVQIVDAAGVIVKEYDSYAAMLQEGTAIELPVGSYKVRSASYAGDEVEASIDKPYYFSEKEFVVTGGEVTSLKDTCKLNSVVVKVNLNDTFLNGIQDNYAITLTNGTGVLTMDKNNSGTAYFRTAPTMKIVVRAKTKEGTDVYKSQLMASNNGESLKPEDEFVIDLGVKDTEPNPGNSHFEITIDVTMNGKDIDIEIPGPDTPDDPNPSYQAPTIIGDNFDIDGLLTDPTTVKVNIAAEAGIRNLIVTIDSPILSDEMLAAVGLKKSFDLANPGDMKKALQELGLLKNESVQGQTSALFDVSTFMAILPQLGDPGPHKFHLKVVDKQGREVSKTLTIQFTITQTESL